MGPIDHAQYLGDGKDAVGKWPLCMYLAECMEKWCPMHCIAVGWILQVLWDYCHNVLCGNANAGPFYSACYVIVASWRPHKLMQAQNGLKDWECPDCLTFVSRWEMDSTPLAIDSLNTFVVCLQCWGATSTAWQASARQTCLTGCGCLTCSFSNLNSWLANQTATSHYSKYSASLQSCIAMFPHFPQLSSFPWVVLVGYKWVLLVLLGYWF